MIKKLKEQLQIEVDAAFLYKQLSENYQDELISQVLRKMSEIENHHAQVVLNKIHQTKPNFQKPEPSFRARLQVKLGKYFGFEFILSNLAVMEWRMSKALIEKKQSQGEKITGLENIHLNIIQSISKQESLGVGGNLLSRFEGKHKSVGGNELRAAVLGANDGLVSNMSLVMGVAGASNTGSSVLIAGIAGLVAGSISMALGEWLSVQSARELFQRQVDIEAEEIESSPEEEMKELALLYQAKGIAETEANKLAQDVFANKETALDALLREELGIDKEVLGGSAWKAAFTSFFLFAFGAIIPVFSFIFFSGGFAILLSLVLSIIGLFTIGASITLYTGKNFYFSGLRQVIFGIAAAAITFTIGRIIGNSLLS